MQSTDELESLLGTTIRSQFRWKCNTVQYVLKISIPDSHLELSSILCCSLIFTSPDFYSLITNHTGSGNLIKVITFGLHFNNTCDLVESPSISLLYIIIPYTLNALAYIFLYIRACEFILFQSPRVMKGLVIGLFFAIKGAFQLLAVLTVYLPFIT